MSCYGTRQTPIFALEIKRVTSFDDEGKKWEKDMFHSSISVFLRVWKWETDISLHRVPGCSWYWSRHGRSLYMHLPRVGSVNVTVEDYGPHQFSGDYTEQTDQIRLSLKDES